MNIKHGYFTTLYDGSEYSAVTIEKDKKGNYKIKSTNPNDLNNGFRKYNSTVLVRDVPEDEVKQIVNLEPYAILKIDPDKNKFYIIEKNDGINYDDKLVLITNDDVLAKKFGLGKCGFDSGIFEKTVLKDEVEIDYDEDKIFVSNSKKMNHQGINQPLSTMKIVAGQPQESSSTHQKITFGFTR